MFPTLHVGSALASFSRGRLRRPTAEMTSVSPAVTSWAWNVAMMAAAGRAELAPQRILSPGRWIEMPRIWRNDEKHGEGGG